MTVVFLIALQFTLACYSEFGAVRSCSAQLSVPPFAETYGQLQSLEEQISSIAGIVPNSLTYPDNPTREAVEMAATPFKALLDQIDRLNFSKLSPVRDGIEAIGSFYSRLQDSTELRVPELESSVPSPPRGELSYIASVLWRVNYDLNAASTAANTTGIRAATKTGTYVCGLLKNGCRKINGELALLRHLSTLVLQMYDISIQDEFILQRQPWRLVVAGWTSFKTEVLHRKADLVELATINREKANVYDRIITSSDVSLLEYAVIFSPDDLAKCSDFMILQAKDSNVKRYHEIMSRSDAGKVTEWRNIRLWHTSSASNPLWYLAKATLCANTYASSDKEFIIIAESLLSPTITFHNYLDQKGQMSKYSYDIEEKMMTFEWDTGKGNGEAFFQSTLDTFPCYEHVGCYVSLLEVQKRKQGICGDKVAMMVQELQRAWDTTPDSIPLPCFPFETGALRNAKGEISSHAILFVKTERGYALVDYFGSTVKGRALWRTYDAIIKSRWTDPDSNSDYHYSDLANKYWFGWGKIYVPFPDGGYAVKVDLQKLYERNDIGEVLSVPYFVAAPVLTTATATKATTPQVTTTTGGSTGTTSKITTTTLSSPAGALDAVTAYGAAGLVVVIVAVLLVSRHRKKTQKRLA